MAPRSRRARRPFHRGFNRLRHQVENIFGALRPHRPVATRYGKLAAPFLAFVTLSAILDWLG